jgi:hypothetical protein
MAIKIDPLPHTDVTKYCPQTLNWTEQESNRIIPFYFNEWYGQRSLLSARGHGLTHTVKNSKNQNLKNQNDKCFHCGREELII